MFLWDCCRYVWLIISLHFCLRGREVQCQLKKDDLVFTEYEDGKWMVTLAKDFLSKNHQGGLAGSSFSSAGCITDPKQVSVLRMYLTHLHPELDRLFQRAHVSSSNSGVWFMKSALSHNQLGLMMSNICAAAGARRYTNHCIRATAIVRLKSSGMEDRKIIAVSGHKNTASLTSYDRVTSSDARVMCTAIDAGFSAESESVMPVSEASACKTRVTSGCSVSSSPVKQMPTAECASSKDNQGFVMNGCTNVTFNLTSPAAVTQTLAKKRKFPFSLKLDKSKRKRCAGKENKA